MSTVRKLRAYRRLGLRNLIQVALYRIGLRTGWHPVVRLRRELAGQHFYDAVEPAAKYPEPPDEWLDSVHYFGWYVVPLVGSSPPWFLNPFNGLVLAETQEPWWKISDFGLPVGDIKTIWELSRFDWALRLAQQAATGAPFALDRLNDWIADWCRANPAYRGPNWKCGQEASFRVLHLALAARFLNQDCKPTASLVSLLEVHLSRIERSLAYGIAQDNNHGTTEAAALFLGGSLCAQGGLRRGERWCASGRKWLENRSRRLIAADGSFSQYSLTYHRLLLDTLSLVECWRRWRQLEPFSGEFLERAALATQWLFHMVASEEGDGPNLGGNDGANLLPLTDADYRDLRPSVQLAMSIFMDRLAYGRPGPHDQQLAWMGVARPGRLEAAPGSAHFADGGHILLRRGPWFALLNYPRYRFRPRHCDALHLDLWFGNCNLLRDAGTFAYNTDQMWEQYFPSTAAHNTVAFDHEEQMPKISRFLRGEWLSTRDVEFRPDLGGEAMAGAGYIDWRGRRHDRRIRVGERRVEVFDAVSGFLRVAVLRWRLSPGSWQLDGNLLRGDQCQISITADVEITRIGLVEGWESRYYQHLQPIQVLEVELRAAGTITTEIIPAASQKQGSS